MLGLRLSPERVRVTTRGEVLVTLEGHGFGRLRVGGERRWVRGRFAEQFAVSRASSSVEIEARWWSGRRTWMLDLEAADDVRAPRLEPAAFRDPADSQRARVPAPRVRAPRFKRISAPQGVALRVRRILEALERSNEF